MKQNIFILIFLISLPNFAFGQEQDTIIRNILSNLNPLTIHKIPPPQKILHNTYELNRQEKDSIWLSIVEEDKTKKLLNNWKYSQSIAIFHSENLLYLMAALNSNTVDRRTKQNLIIGKIEYDKTQVKDKEDPYYIWPRGGFLEGSGIENYSSKNDAVQNYIQVHSKADTNLFLIPGTIFVGGDLKNEKWWVRIDKKDEITLKKTLNFIRKIEIRNVELLVPLPEAIFGGNPGLTIYYLKK